MNLLLKTGLLQITWLLRKPADQDQRCFSLTQWIHVNNHNEIAPHTYCKKKLMGFLFKYGMFVGGGGLLEVVGGMLGLHLGSFGGVMPFGDISQTVAGTIWLLRVCVFWVWDFPPFFSLSFFLYYFFLRLFFGSSWWGDIFCSCIFYFKSQFWKTSASKDKCLQWLPFSINYQLHLYLCTKCPCICIINWWHRGYGDF